MNFLNKKKLQDSAMSLETSCTSEENREKMIKINLITPKKENSQKFQGAGRLDSIKEKEEILTDSKRRNSEIVTAPNKIVKAQGLTFAGFLKGEEERNNVKQQHISNNGAITLPYSLKTSSILARSQATSSSISSNVFAPMPSPKIQNRQSLGKTSYFKQEKEINAIKNANINNASSNSNHKNNSNDSDCISEVLEMIDIDNTRQEPFVSNYSSAFDFKSKESLAFNPKMPARPTLMQSSQRSDSKSNSKMKLRDYLYMVEATSKHSSKKHTNPQELPPTLTSNKGTPTQTLRDSSRLQRGSITSRKDSQKYSISNAMMFDILKKEIHDDINHVMHSLKRLDEELASVQPKSDEPPNEDLLVLYSVRRQIKQEMNKKLQAAIESIKGHKMNRNQPATHTQKQRKRSYV